MKIQLLKMKADLKQLAKEIRTLKSTRKSFSTGYVPGLSYAQYSFRAQHIAYCLLRGRTLEQIEPKLRDPSSSSHTSARREAARIVESVLNPKPPVIEAPQEALWDKVISFLF